MDGTGAKILIVDDERFMIDLIVDLLRGHFKTLVAKTGERALEIADSRPPPDLILLLSCSRVWMDTRSAGGSRRMPGPGIFR